MVDLKKPPMVPVADGEELEDKLCQKGLKGAAPSRPPPRPAPTPAPPPRRGQRAGGAPGAMPGRRKVGGGGG